MRIHSLFRILIHLFLIASCCLILLPVVWMISVSFSPTSNPFGRHLLFIPQAFSLEGFVQVFMQTPIIQWFLNSMLVATVSTFGQLIIGVLAAYAFAKYSFKWKEPLFFFVLCTMMIPPQSIMLPTYLVVNSLDWINSFKGVIIPHLANAYAVFVLRQFFMMIPKELDEASTIDGCNSFQSLIHIYLRNSYPVLFGVGLILFVNNWNDYYWPLLILNDWESLTLPVAIITFRSESFIEWVPTMAAATLSVLPAVIIYIFAQKYFTEGALHSGIK